MVLILIALDLIYTQLKAKQHQKLVVCRRWEEIKIGAQWWWCLGDLFQCSIQLLLDSLVSISKRKCLELVFH